METVQIKCGSCNRIMAISIEHLGSQVHCPHCQAIVQAPPRPAGKAVEDRGDGGETESIFAGPEVTDDIFNSGPSGPLVEMPLEKFTQKRDDASSSESMGTMPYMPPEGPKVPNFKLAKANEETREAPSWSDGSPVGQENTDNADNANLAALQPRRVEKQSALAPILLIFLVPYAILATLVIAYLLINQSRGFDPLERLPDPKPKDGGPRVQERVVHDWPLPNKLKTRLNEPLRIGALQVTPVKVLLTRDNHLVLHLKLKNVSPDLVFNPVSEEFMKFTPGMVTTRPYTFLDWSQKKLYGGFSERQRVPEGKEVFFDGDIGPGEEELVRIFTGPKYQDDVKRLANSQESLVWRVQVRRGFVDVRGSQVSATAVVGVEFNTKAIEKES